MPTAASQPLLPVLVIAPFGRDSSLIAGALKQANIECEICDARAALPRLAEYPGAVLIEEEALDEELIQQFRTALQSQPAWSDAPLIVLTNGRGVTNRASLWMARMRQPLGHTTLLERPIRPETLVSTVETVLRARHRQFQIRDALDQLKASEARYRSLTLATSSIVWTADLHGSMVERLPSWEAFTGQIFEQYQGRGWCKAIHPNDREASVAAIFNAIARMRPFQLEFRLQRHDGIYRCVLARGVPVFREDASVKEWVGTCTDVQARKDSEVALRRSERLAMAGQLAASIAHEINNPLEAVTNLIYLMSTRATDEEVRQFGAIAQRELSRVSEISGQTLRFYRKNSQPVDTDVADLLESLLQLFHPKFRRRNLQLHTDFRSGNTVLSFPNELRQLFANLISNAIDATPPGGRIQLASKPGMDWRDPSRRGVRISVADNGSGISKAIQQKIFEAFVTTKGDSGTGLGLWVCDDIVQRHGGVLRLRSRETNPSGTVFSVFLPANHVPASQLAESGSATDLPTSQPS